MSVQRNLGSRLAASFWLLRAGALESVQALSNRIELAQSKFGQRRVVGTAFEEYNQWIGDFRVDPRHFLDAAGTMG